MKSTAPRPAFFPLNFREDRLCYDPKDWRGHLKGMRMLTIKRLLATAVPTTIGLLGAAGLLAMLGAGAWPAAAAPESAGIRYVTPTGSDTANACASLVTPCQSIQWALDQAQAGDQIWVATGVYTGAGGTVANITQTVTLQGGWNISFTQNVPASQPTVLNGQGLQPVVVISPTALPSGAQITPTVEGVLVTHGRGQSAYCGNGVVVPADCGGGIASLYADPLIVNNVISGNVGASNSFGFGGGIYMFHAGAGALISGNLVYSNIANIGGTGLGGGILAHESLATIQNNTIQRNHDSILGTGLGGGIQMFFSHGSILGNALFENVSSNRGGGIQVNENHGTIVIHGNSFLSNTALAQGGGLFISGDVAAQISNNLFSGNSVTSTAKGRGGAIRISSDNAGVTIQENVFNSNAAAWGGGSAIDLAAGGLVDGNFLSQNQNGQWGAALVLSGTAQGMTATNNLVVNNLGGGIEAINVTQPATIVNNTVVGSGNFLSGTAGTGILVTFDLTPVLPVTVTLVNNIVLNSAACGIDAHNAASVISHHNDVRGNTPSYCGSANGAGNASFDPLFVNAGGGDYHLSPASLAINSGSNPEAPAKDKDGISRPVGLWADIGAYESLFGYPLHLPLIGR